MAPAAETEKSKATDSRSQPAESAKEFLERLLYLESRSGCEHASTSYASTLDDEIVEMWRSRAHWDDTLAKL